MIFVEVAVAAPVKQTLTYSFEGMETSVTDLVGRRISVPLGRRKVTGYILAVSGERPDGDFTIRKVSQLCDPVPLFHAHLVNFFRWVADYYHYPVGLVIKAALPGGLAGTTRKTIRLPEIVSEQLQDLAKTNDWIRELLDKGNLTSQQYAKIAAGGDSGKLLRKLLAAGELLVEEHFGGGTIGEKIEVCYELIAPKLSDVHVDPASDLDMTLFRANLKAKLKFDVKLSEAKAIYYLLRSCEDCNDDTVSLQDLRKCYPNIVAPLTTLEQKGVIRRTEQRIFRAPIGARFKKYPRPETLTKEQTVAVEAIYQAIEADDFRPFLLHGITGSGKTEVYLRGAEKALAAGKDVLIIVPEIALATQLEAHLLSRFDKLVALMHSGMTKAEKFDQYCRVLHGEARVVIGARSAVFAPLKNPGLIIVDEEHDSSLKQDDGFRYNGRDLAVVRAKEYNCVVVLGSATPSVTTYSNAIRGKYQLLEMTCRVGQGSLPEVEIDNLGEAKAKHSSSVIQESLRHSLESNLENNKQSILLINRRGFSAALICQDCGTPVQCMHCHVSLTVHKRAGKLVCHYCGFTNHLNTLCSQCRSAQLVPAGFGTERIEDEIKSILPEARVARLDSDVSTNRQEFIDILAKMHNQEIDILIGTQMIAKGHHFPNVTLVGVVWADGGMSMPDFRASERTFQLLTQVIGRAGRGDVPGKVIIQTLRPEHYAIEFARKHDYQGLFQREMKLRSNPEFPPYVRLVCLRLQGRVEAEVRQICLQLVKFCRTTIKTLALGIEVLGPAPSPLDKIKDNYRWQILLKGKSPEELRTLASAIEEQKQFASSAKCTLAIDIDPESMM